MQKTTNQLTLGQFIAQLEALENQDSTIKLENQQFPNDVRSYRGYYEDLSIEPSDKPITVAECLNMLKKAVGSFQYGWKGGEYQTEEETAVWVSPMGVASNDAVTGVVNDPDYGYTVTTEKDTY